MSKYDDLINKMQDEINEIEVPKDAKIIKARFEASKKQKRCSFNFKKLVPAFMSVFLLVIIMVLVFTNRDGIVSPSTTLSKTKTTSTSSTNSNTTVTSGTFDEIVTVIDDTYGESLKSASTIIYGTVNSGVIQTAVKLSNDTVDFETISQEIQKYVFLMQAYLSNNNPELVYVESNDAKYEIQANYVYNNEVISTLYLNKSDPVKDDDEIEYNITGIMKVGNITYKVTGEVETETNEQEFELTIYDNDVRYLTISHETELSEAELEYTFYDNSGRETRQFQIEYENNEVTFEFESEVNDEIEGEFVARLDNGVIILDGEINEYEGKIRISVGDDEVTYVFVDANNKQIVISYSENKKTEESSNKNQISFV